MGQSTQDQPTTPATSQPPTPCPTHPSQPSHPPTHQLHQIVSRMAMISSPKNLHQPPGPPFRPLKSPLQHATKLKIRSKYLAKVKLPPNLLQHCSHGMQQKKGRRAQPKPKLGQKMLWRLKQKLEMKQRLGTSCSQPKKRKHMVCCKKTVNQKKAKPL